jgi:outer membrane receptor for ferrienterochelin and colicins
VVIPGPPSGPRAGAQALTAFDRCKPLSKRSAALTAPARPSTGLALILPLLAWPWYARADPAYTPDVKDIEELDLSSLLSTPEDVWTASKSEQKNYEAPAIITTVTRDQIAVWGYRSVAELLSHLLGFYVVDDHTMPNLAVRGISGGLYADSSIVKVLIDGHSVAFHSTGGNWLGPELLPLSAIERIEIVRGPASALFGADAFLGVINIKTRSAKSLSGVTAGLTGGYAGRKLATDIDVAAGAEWGPFDVLASVRRGDQDLSGLGLPASSPAPAIPAYHDGSRTAHGLDQHATTALVRLSWRPRPSATLAAFGYLSAFDRGAEFGSLLPLANGTNSAGIFAENRAAMSQQRAGALWDQTLGPRLRLMLRGSVFRGAPLDDNRVEVGSEFYYVRRQFHFRGLDVDGQLEWTPEHFPLGTLRLVAGASNLVDDEHLPSRLAIAKQPTEQAQTGQVIDAISIRQGHKTFVNAGAYLQSTWGLLPELLSLTGGLRYDHHNVYGSQLSERVGLVWSPLSTFYGKLLYGTAFKAPSPTLLHTIPSSVGDVVGNPQLAPQYVRTLELQVAIEPAEFLSLSSNVAFSVVNDKTEFVQVGINQVARNVARAATASWETMLELKYGGTLRSHLSLELQRTTRETGHDGYLGEVVGAGGGIYPALMVHAGAVVQPSGFPARAAVQASYVGRRRASDTNILLNAGRYDLPAYVMLDANLSTRGFDAFNLQRCEISFALAGKNLLGTKGPAAGFSGVDYPLGPRSFFLQTTLAF